MLVYLLNKFLCMLVISGVQAHFTHPPVLTYYYLVQTLITLGSCSTGTYFPMCLLLQFFLLNLGLSNELGSSNSQYGNSTAVLQIFSQVSSTSLS